MAPHTQREAEMSQEIQMKNKGKLYQLTCQNCHKLYKTIKDLKVHIRSKSHKQEVAMLFQTVAFDDILKEKLWKAIFPSVTKLQVMLCQGDVHKGLAFFPILTVVDYLWTPNQTDPLIGLDMVTFCITPEKYGAFYLCHVCEERLSSQDIIRHLCSVDHYFKYLAYSNPELLQFSWFKDSYSYLQTSAVQENRINGCGSLRILELPKVMLKRGKSMPYHQVMMMFSKRDKLTECVRANRPQRKTLQAYITDPNRSNPLLGLDFLVEYSCPDSEWNCAYLCLLCKKKLPAIESISHCIGFDHVYWYLQAAHPTTLECPKSSYTHNSYRFYKKILSLANQAQRVHPPGEIQSVHLDLAGFKDVASCSYMNALDKLQKMRRERNQSEFKTNVTPGERLCYALEAPASSVSITTTVCSAEWEEETHKDSGAQNRDRCQFILCVECDRTLSFISEYKNHIKESKHKQKLVDLFGQGSYTGNIGLIKLYQYLWTRHLTNSSPPPPPLIGLQLLTVLVNRQSHCSSSPLYLCHACEINISASASTHLTSTQHYFNVFAHTKPDLVFLGAQNLNKITEFAQEEEAKQGKAILRVCEISSHLGRMFKSLAYERIMATIQKQHTELSKCFEVPKRVTLQSYAQSCDRKSPLLGLQFMVKYSTTKPYPKCGYLCLLCERKLSEMHAIPHVLSSAHVYAYLNEVHPGSLSQEEEEEDHRSLIVDLAHQAETIYPHRAFREVELDFGKFHELDTSPFKAALDALQLYFGQNGLEELRPSLVPGARLVSSLEKKHAVPCVEQESLSMPSETKQINPDATHTQMSTPKTGLTLPKLQEPPKSTDPAKPLSATSAHLVPSEASINTRQKEPMEVGMEFLGQAVPLYHNTTEANELYPTAKPPQTQHSSFAQQDSTLPQNNGETSESSQKLRQTLTYVNKAEAVPQSSPACSELWTYLKTANREPVVVSSLEKKHPVPYVEQESLSMPSETKQINPDATHTETSTPKTDPAKPLSATSAHLLPSEESINTQQKEPMDVGMEFLGQAVPLYHNTTEANELYPTAKPPQTQHSSFAQQESALAQNNGETSESSQKLRQTPTCVNKAEAVPQSSPACSKLWTYLKKANREPVIGLNSVVECLTDGQPPFYICVSCTKRVAESSVIGHLTGHHHRISYLKSIKHAPLLAKRKVKAKWLRKHAFKLEKREGYGEAQVLELNAKDYHQTVSAPIETVLRKLRDFLLKLTSKSSDQSTLPSSSFDSSRCALQSINKTEQKDNPSGHLRGSVITDVSVPVVKKEESSKLKKQPSRNVENSSNANQANPPQTSSETDVENSSNANEGEQPQTSSKAVCTEQQDQNSKRQKATKLLKKTKMKQLIGLDFVTCVTHDKKKLFFCELCSVRCHLDHMSSVTHKKTCVEHRYPGWTESDANMKRLNVLALRLAAVERSAGIGMKKLRVSAKVFTALRTAPLSEALSQLKLQQTKLEAGVDLRGSLALHEPNSNTAADCTQGTNNEVEKETLCSAKATSSLQQEQAPVLEASGIPDAMTNLLSGIHSVPIKPLDPCSISSYPVSFLSTLPSPCDSSSPNLHTPTEPYSILTSPVPLPPLPHSISQPPSIPDLSPVSSRPASSQSLYLPPPVYEPISPPPIYEPISPPSLSKPQPISPPPYACSLFSPTPSTAFSQITVLQPFKSHLMEGEDQTDVCAQSILREESRPLVTVPPHMNSFLNLPTVAGQSNAYLFLSLRNLLNTEPVIGLSNVVECRTTARPTFFLCLNCAVKVTIKDFCHHMTSEQHQYFSIRIQYPGIFQEWQWQTSHKLTIHDLVERLALEEQGLDAMVIKLDQKQYESLESADFHSALNILHRMYGPEPSRNSPPLHLTGKTQKDVFTAKLPQDCEKTDRETHRLLPWQNHDLSTSQTTQYGLHSGQVQDKALDCMHGNPDRSTEMSNLIRDQSPPKIRKGTEMTEAQAQQSQHEFKSGEFESRNTGSPFPETCTESTADTPSTGCANSLAAQTPESTAKGLQQITAETFPRIIKIKQEKPDYDKVSPKTCSFAVAPSLDAPSSKEATGNPCKHTANLKEYINSKRAVSDAVVGLSSVIECQSKGQPPLYLCVSCSSKLSHDHLISHLLKPGHRDSYLRCRYPWMFENWSDNRTQNYVMLMRLAHKVEKTFEDEPGQLQEIDVQCGDLKEIKDLPFDKAITQLQKIRKEQRLSALQTCISPKIQTVLVKQENIEIEVTTQHSAELADVLEMTTPRPKTASKRRAAEPDSPHDTPPVVKQIKLSSAVTSGQEMLEQPKPWTCDHQMPSPPSSHAPPKSTTTNMVSSKESLPRNHGNTQQKSRHLHADQLHVSLSSSKASPPSPSDQYSFSTQNPTTSNKLSQKSSVQTKSVVKTKPNSSIPGTHKAATDSRFVAQTSPDSFSEKLEKQSASFTSKTCLKRQHSESKAQCSLSRKQSTDVPPSHLRQSPSLLNIPVSSECPVKRRCSVEETSQVQKENSIFSTDFSERSQSSHSNFLRDSDPTTHTGRATLTQPSSKNSDGQALCFTNLPPQQMLHCPNAGIISVPSMQAQGQEIARLHERPLVINRSNENAWNYENRQFSSDTLNTKQVVGPSGKADWKVPAKDPDISAYACVDNTAMSYPIPAHNADSYFSEASGCGRTTFVTSPVMPRYAMPYPYLGYKPAGYTPASVASNSIAHNYAVATDKSAINVQSAVAGIPTNAVSLTDSNSVYTSQLVYQSQQVYQPTHGFQSPEAYEAYYAFYACNQAHQTNQAATFTGNVTPAASAYGHMPTN